MLKNTFEELPLTVYVNKKMLLKNICIAAPCLIFSVYFLLISTGTIPFGDDLWYSVKGFIGSAVVMLVTLSVLAKSLISLFKFKPVIEIREQGLYIFEKPLNELGTIQWKEIDTFRDMVFYDAFNPNGRKFCFASKNLMSLINALTDIDKRKKILKACKRNSNWLYRVNANQLNCDPDHLVKLIATLIAKNQTNSNI